MCIGLSPGHGPWVNVFGLLDVSSLDCALYYVLCRVMFLVFHWDLARGLKSFFIEMLAVKVCHCKFFFVLYCCWETSGLGPWVKVFLSIGWGCVCLYLGDR